jgi:hypothetical protein
MDETAVEALLSSPPERDDLVVQLFVEDGHCQRSLKNHPLWSLTFHPPV